MKRISIWLATASLALAPLALDAQTTPAAVTPSAAAPATMSGMAAPTPVPTPSLVDDIIKLWKANLSEEFLKKYVSTSDIIKELSAEDIVRLRTAGLPESLILTITQRKMELAGTATPAATAPGAAAGARAPASDSGSDAGSHSPDDRAMGRSGAAQFRPRSVQEPLGPGDPRGQGRNPPLDRLEGRLEEPQHSAEEHHRAAAHVSQEVRRERVLRVGRQDAFGRVPLPQHRLGAERERQGRGRLLVHEYPRSEARVVAGPGRPEVGAPSGVLDRAVGVRPVSGTALPAPRGRSTPGAGSA